MPLTLAFIHLHTTPAQSVVAETYNDVKSLSRHPDYCQANENKIYSMYILNKFLTDFTILYFEEETITIICS